MFTSHMYGDLYHIINRTPKKIRDENDDEGVASFADSFDYDFDADKEFVEKQRAKTPTNTDSSTAAGIIR